MLREEGGTTLNSVLKRRPEGGSRGKIWRKTPPGGANSRCKGHEAGLTCLKGRTTKSVLLECR